MEAVVELDVLDIHDGALVIEDHDGLDHHSQHVHTLRLKESHKTVGQDAPHMGQSQRIDNCNHNVNGVSFAST